MPELESNTFISKTKSTFRYRDAHPVGEKELDAYWKNLRNFYRTGEKFDKDITIEKMRPVSVILAGENRSPGPLNVFQKVVLLHHTRQRQDFMTQLKDHIDHLKLLIPDAENEQHEDQAFDFAHELIAFEKLAALTSRTAEESSDTRIIRISEIMRSLHDGLKEFEQQKPLLIISKALKSKFPDETFREFNQLLMSKNGFRQVVNEFNDRIAAHTDLIRSVRMASLEASHRYEEEVHDDYFSHFVWHRLTEEEVKLAQPVVLVVSEAYVSAHLADFSELLTLNLPVKIMVIKTEMTSEPSATVSWMDAAHRFRQELTAIAIAHRNTYTFQTVGDQVETLEKGFIGMLESTGPSFAHVLIPDQSSADHSLWAAQASRYFPSIIYDPSKGKNGFDLNDNVQNKEDWPRYTLGYSTEDGSEEEMEVYLTYADYKAMYASKIRELVLVPEAYQTKHLVPLREYLDLDLNELYGKIPFIWLSDQDQVLHKCVVPYVWVASCQERRRNWMFFRDLAGINEEDVIQTDGQLQSAESTSFKFDGAPAISDPNKLKEEAMHEAIARIMDYLVDDQVT